MPINYSLTNSDLSELIDTNIYILNDLKRFNNIDDVLGPDGSAYILIETDGENQGHWLLLFKKGKTIEFFDSFGIKPDEQKFFVEDEQLDRNNYLSMLLKKSPYTITYNHYKFQELDATTCGRWISMRLYLKDYTLRQFKDLIVKLTKKYDITPDELVFYYTKHFLGK